MRKLIAFSLVGPALAAGCLFAPQGAAQVAGAQDLASDFQQFISWTTAGNGLTDAHSAPFEFLLSRDTLPLVRPRWIFSADGEVQGTPTVAGNDLFFSDAAGSVWRLEAVSGNVVWKTSLPGITGDSMAYSRVSPAIAPDVVIVGDQDSGTVYALARDTGKLVWKTVLATAKGAYITSSPVVAGGRVYVGVSSGQENLAAKDPGFVPDFRGSVAALDLKTGNVVWQTYIVPQGYTGGSVWAGNLAVDMGRSTVYVPTGNNYSVPPAVKACQTKATTPAQLDACLSPDDHIDSVMAVDMNTGAIRWSQRFTHSDTWTVSCKQSSQPPATPCPTPTGLDTDFGSGPNLFTIQRNGKSVDVIGNGQKSGAYYAMDRDTGTILWGTQVGPQGNRGGIEWGTAADQGRIYIPLANSNYTETTLMSGQKVVGGYWAALDQVTGQILWETPTFAPAPVPSSPRGTKPPAGAMAEAEGSVSVANGVMYGEDAAGNFVALDAASGEILDSFQSGGAGLAAPAIAAGTLYWSSGYSSIGTTNNKVYALSILGLD